MKTDISELVSIIVPVYNVEKYLEECVLSLLNQTYSLIEIILVDDGATDSSGQLCDKLRQKDARIKVIHKRNEGLGFARNSGLDIASGKYVTFFDSDDYADINFINDLIEGLMYKNADTCVGGYKRVTEDGKNIITEYKNKKCFYQGSDGYNVFFARMLGSLPNKHDAIRMSVWSTLYSLDIINMNNIRFPSERVMISEDIIFNEEYYRKSGSVYLTDACGYNYRVSNGGSLTTKYIGNRLQLICDLYVEMENRVKASFKSKNEIFRLQRQFFVNLTSCYRQVFHKEAHNSFWEAYKEVRKINSNVIVRSILNEYPIEQIQFKPRIFLELIKFRSSLIITILAKIGGV